MADSKTAAEALYEAIETMAKQVDDNYSGTMASTIIRDLAIAYRAVKGGAQPGNVFIENE